MLVGRFRKLLNVLFNGRNTVVYFGEPMRLRDALADLPPQRSVRRVLRALRAEFRAQRASTIGPDLSHRRTMVAHILRTQAVRHAVRGEMQARLARARELRGRARARQLNRARRRAVLRTARRVRDGDRRELFADLRHASWPPSWRGCGPGCTTAWNSSTSKSCTRSATAPRSSTFPAIAATWITCCFPT